MLEIVHFQVLLNTERDGTKRAGNLCCYKGNTSNQAKVTLQSRTTKLR